MAIAELGTAVSAQSTAAANTISVSHTLGSGTNRLAVVVVTTYRNGGDPNITGITYGGVAMTELVDKIQTVSSDRFHAAIWYLKNADMPSDGSKTVTATYDESNTKEMQVAVQTFSGVDQTTPFTDSDSTGSSSSVSASLTLTTVSGDMAIDCLNTYTGTRTIGADQTLVKSQVDAGSTTDLHFSKETATGTSTTMSWTFTGQENAYVAGNMLQATGGGAAAVPQMAMIGVGT